MPRWVVFGLSLTLVLAVFRVEGQSGDLTDDPLDQMVIAFDGTYTRIQIKDRLDKAIELYNLPKTKENYSRAGSTLVALRKETGQKEMDILDYMIRSYVQGMNMDFPSAAGLAASFLSAGDHSDSRGGEATHKELRDDIIERCRLEMNDYGSAMVKACVDQDLEAFNALLKYPSESKELIERCKAQMVSYGWNIVKACVDQDIEAQVALQRYPVDYKSIVARCESQMGSHGWNMVKACADQDIAAEKALRKY